MSTNWQIEVIVGDELVIVRRGYDHEELCNWAIDTLDVCGIPWEIHGYDYERDTNAWVEH